MFEKRDTIFSLTIFLHDLKNAKIATGKKRRSRKRELIFTINHEGRLEQSKREKEKKLRKEGRRRRKGEEEKQYLCKYMRRICTSTAQS